MEINCCEEDEKASEICILWKREYKYLYTIKNMYNGNILYPVGSSCITKFDRKDLREKITLMESQFKLLHAVEEGKFLSLSVELFSRKLLLWLYEEGAIYSRWWRIRG